MNLTFTLYAFPIALLLGALPGCQKKEEGTASAQVASAGVTPRPAAAPTKFERKYAGALGEDAKATMRLVRDGERVSGEYAYTKIGRSIGLAGKAAADGSIELAEGIDGKNTGTFKGKLTSDGTFSGTWTSANGDKQLPFRFEESNAAVVPPLVTAAPKPATGKQLAIATTDEAAEALVKVAKLKGRVVDRAIAAKDFDGIATWGHASDGAERRRAFKDEYGLDLYSGGYARLYVADVNNDGDTDYVFFEQNPVGLHNDDIVAVFLGKGGAIVRAEVPEIPELERTVTNFSLSVDPEGTVMYFTEAGGPKGKVHRVLWKGNAAKHL